MNENHWHILLIDDSPDDRADLRQMLLRNLDRRYTFTEAELGSEGISKILERRDIPFDCVLLDFHLPDMDAEQVLNELYKRSSVPTCPVVVITGSETKDKINGSKLLLAGAQDYIGKNWITPEGLSRSVENAIDRFALFIKREQIESDLKKALKAAEKANLAKSDFLSHMSHELRTPLNAILGFAQLLEAGVPTPTSIQMIRLNEILKAGWYLLNLINEILDLAMIESGKSTVSLKPVLLSKILFECQSMLGPQAKKSEVSLRFISPDSTWYVHADQTKLKQVLTNLLSNAIKYNKKNGIVEVLCSESTLGRLRIIVKDNGTGFPMEKMEQLFQPFNRLGQEVGTKEGAGIGLAVSKKMVELMGGTIGVESTVGLGSEFWIELDREDSSQPVLLIRLPEELVSKPKNDAARYTLLYVEDNPANLMLVEHIIGDHPHIRMLSAPDGTRAIAIAQELLPDIILMDINLPGISGIETMIHLHKDSATKHIPILALSANAMSHEINQGLEAGFFSYLTKPIKNNELVEALDAAIACITNEQDSA